MNNEIFGIASRDTMKYRADPRLIACIEKLGDEASGSSSEIVIASFDQFISDIIHTYDGLESIHD